MFRIYRIAPGFEFFIRQWNSSLGTFTANVYIQWKSNCAYANFAAICNLVCNAYCTAALNKCHCNNNEIPCVLEFRSHVHRCTENSELRENKLSMKWRKKLLTKWDKISFCHISKKFYTDVVKSTQEMYFFYSRYIFFINNFPCFGVSHIFQFHYI